MKKLLINTILSWLPLSAAVVCTFGIMYLAVQQYIRLSADELPLQYAENVKVKMESGTPLSEVIRGTEPVDMQKSLSPFVIICNGDGNVLSSTTLLHNNHPVPQGVLTFAKRYGENRRTWQPAHTIRNAIVVLPWSINGNEGYIIGGRSLREVEKREHFLLIQIAAGLVITLFVTFAGILVMLSVKKQLLTTIT
jgi:hypothetical protein